MHTLTEAQYQVEAEPIFRLVFASDNQFGETFTPNITARRILYPLSFYLEQPFLQALIKAASSVGDTGCYLSRPWLDSNEPNHCYIPLSELLEGYVSSPGSEKLIGVQLEIELFTEYCLYSSQGKWGLLLCYDYYGVLGGSSQFIEQVRRVVPNLDEQVELFLRNYQQEKADGAHLTLNWLPGLLAHVYGQETAKRLLRQTGLP